MLKSRFVKNVIPFIILGTLFLFAVTPMIIKSVNEHMGQRLVFTMYDFHPMNMIEQNEALRKLLSPDIADRYLLSNDSRQLAVYLRFEMRSASPVILAQDNLSVIFTIEGDAMEPDRIFQIIFTHRFGKITSIREFELTPIPPTGIWNFK